MEPIGFGCLAGRTWESAPLPHDDIHELLWDYDYLHHGLARDEGLNLLVRQRGFLQVFLRRPVRDRDAPAQLAIHLDRDFQQDLACQVFVELGPGLFEDRAGLAQ